MNLWQASLSGGAAFKEVDTLLQGLDWAEATTPPVGAPYSVAELLAHIAVTMRVSLDLISGRVQGWPEDLDVWPPAPRDSAGFTALLSDLKLMLTEVQLLAQDPTQHAREILLDLAVHNAYHWGQVALLRRMQGADFATSETHDA